GGAVRAGPARRAPHSFARGLRPARAGRGAAHRGAGARDGRALGRGAGGGGGGGPAPPPPPARVAEMVRWLRARHPERFPSEAAARAALEHPLVAGACVVGLGGADVMVGGATFPSGDTIRAALWGVGLAPGVL